MLTERPAAEVDSHSLFLSTKACYIFEVCYTPKSSEKFFFNGSQFRYLSIFITSFFCIHLAS
jgi:hypothetical protein